MQIWVVCGGQKGVSDSLELGVKSGCEPLNVGAGNLIQVFHKGAQLLSQLPKLSTISNLQC